MKSLESYSFRKTWGALYQGIKTNAGKDKLSNLAVFMARRMLFVLVLLQDSFYAKWTSLIILSVVQISYYLSVRPHEKKDLHYLEIFNESMLLGALYFLLSQTEFVSSPETRYNFAWAFNCIILLPLIAVNFAHTFFIGVRQTYGDFKAYMKRGNRVVIEHATE